MQEWVLVESYLWKKERRMAWKVKRMPLFTLPCVMHECRRRVYFGHWRAPWFYQSVQSSSFPSEEKWSPFLYITVGCWNYTGQQAVPEKQKHTKTKESHLSTLGIDLFSHVWKLCAHFAKLPIHYQGNIVRIQLVQVEGWCLILFEKKIYSIWTNRSLLICHKNSCIFVYSNEY